MAPLEEGWYLMSVSDLEIALARWRGEPRTEDSNAIPLTTADALAFKAAGNVPDGAGRSLRLLLYVGDEDDVARLGDRRIVWEPNLHDSPTWRREGSVPVNIVPLRRRRGAAAEDAMWSDDPALAALEDEWRGTGAVAGVRIPAEYRGFVYKTIIALQSSSKGVTVEAIASSIERWLTPEDAARVRAALEDANG